MNTWIKIISILLIFMSHSCSYESNDRINYRIKPSSIFVDSIRYENGNWEHPKYNKPFQSLGNHRFVIETPKGISGNVQVIIPWRRRDNNPSEKALIIVDANTQEKVANVLLLDINNEFGHFIFEANDGAKKYYVYYLSHVSTGGYYPKVEYNKPMAEQDPSWLSMVEKETQNAIVFPKAKVISSQSIDQFNSFFPMEIIATETETKYYFEQHDQPYYLFPEYREHSIKLKDYLPQRWMQTSKINGLTDTIPKGSFYTFQIGVYAPNMPLNDLQINYSELKSNSGNHLSKSLITNYNSEGVDLNGNSFSKKVNVPKRKLIPLWFGIEIPKNATADTYLTQIIIAPEGLSADTTFVKIHVKDEIIENYGDDNPHNMSRLHWLNSTIGRDDDIIVRPFTAVKATENLLHILGRDISVNKFGLPQKISSYFAQELTHLNENPEELLTEPITFEIIEGDKRVVNWQQDPLTLNQSHPSSMHWNVKNNSEKYILDVFGTIEYDGMLAYQIDVIAKEDVTVEDIRMRIPFQKKAAKYLIGLGMKGGGLTHDLNWKWDISKHQEGLWLGNVNKGLQYVLRDENYERPLNTNFYQTKPLNLPTSWYNEGKGGINVTIKSNKVEVVNYSGPRDLKRGDTLHFICKFLITPFKTIDTQTHFNTRFVHKYVPIDSVINLKGTVVNVHHANEINPYINYPFYNLDKQKAYVDEAHAKGIKVKLYNTIRELTYKAPELFALKSLGDEVLNDGDGGGHSWLQEHLKDHYHSAWHATRVNDAAILNKGNSRWTNYYIEGINWLAKNQEIDGLYLDDIAFSRETVKRIVNVLNTHRKDYVIDLHSANQYNIRDGFTNSALLYMEHFPFISRLWFGEYFEYDLGPDYWLTEVSGLPFGLTGEMLEKGGHPFRGLVYGMTTRVYGNFDPGALWGLFDEYQIADSEMLGYWVDRSPIKTNHPNIKSTIYLNEKNVLIAIGSWSNNLERVPLIIEWEKLGFDPNQVRLISPEIKGLQDFQTFSIGDLIPVNKNEGIILVLSRN